MHVIGVVLFDTVVPRVWRAWRDYVERRLIPTDPVIAVRINKSRSKIVDLKVSVVKRSFDPFMKRSEVDTGRICGQKEVDQICWLMLGPIAFAK